MRAPVGWDDLRHELLAVDAGGGYVLFGSAVLLLHGIRKHVGDIDVYVTPVVYDRLGGRGWEEQRPHPTDPPFLEFTSPWCPRVHAFFDWSPRDDWMRGTLPAALREAEMREGWRCAPLDIVRGHKYGCIMQLAREGVDVAGTVWEKHVHDVRAIDAHLMKPATVMR